MLSAAELELLFISSAMLNYVSSKNPCFSFEESPIDFFCELSYYWSFRVFLDAGVWISFGLGLFPFIVALGSLGDIS